MTYTRRPGHWETDTSQRRAFEAKARKAIRADGEFELLDSTDSFDEVDFELGCRGRRVFVEVKEKKQRYRDAWVDASGIAEEDLFILDELSARKIILRSPRAYLVVHDENSERIVLYGSLELLTIPKVRVNRSIDGGVATYKGKWLIDFRHGEAFASVPEALVSIKRRCSSEDEAWRSLACHGRYPDEVVVRL